MANQLEMLPVFDQLPSPGPSATDPPWARRPRGRTVAGRRMRAGPGASCPAAEGSARECVARPEERLEPRAQGITQQFSLIFL
jgi:hypothetical protein